MIGIDLRDMTTRELAEVCEQAAEVINEWGFETARDLDSIFADDPKALALARAELEIDSLGADLLLSASKVLAASAELHRIREEHRTVDFELVPAWPDEGE